MKPKFHIRPLLTALPFLFVTSVQAQQYWNTNGTAASITAANWGAVPAGPFTNAYVANTEMVFGANSTVTYVTTTNVGNFTVNDGFTVTWTAAGTMTTSGAVRTLNVGTGAVLDMAAQNFSTAAGTGFIKDGAGTLITANVNAYTGGFTLNAGTVAVGGVSALGGGGSLTINGGTIRSNNATARDLTGKYAGGITIGGNFTLGDAVNFGLLTFSDAMPLGASTRTLTVNGGAVLSSVISGSPGVGLVKEGAGALVLANIANTYDGPTTINAGTVSFRTGDADGASASYAFPAGSAIGLGVGTGRFTDPEVLAIFSGTVPTSLPTVTINAATNISIDTIAAAHTLSSNIPVSTRGLEKILGGANLTLTGANQYSGRTVVWGAGGLVVTSLGNIADASSNVGTNSTIDLMTGARIDINGATPATSNKNFNIAGSSTIFAATSTGTLNLSGSISTETAGAKTVTLGTNATTIAHTVSGTISDGSGTLAVTRGSNPGRWVLSGNNTYSGGTTLSNGITDINSATAVGTGPLTTGATMDNSSGAAITLSNNNQVNWNANFTFTGTNDLNLGTGNVIMNGNRQVTVTAGRLTMGGIVSATGANGWTKLGNGTLALTNSSSTNSGRNTHSAGVVEVSTMANFSAVSSLGAQSSSDGLWIAGGATLRYVGSADVTTNRGFTLSSAGGSIIESSGVGTLSFGTPANGLAYNTANQPRSLVVGGTNTGTNTFGKVLANNGTGATPLATAFIIGATSVTLASVDGVLTGASISGTGIAAATTITAIDPVTRVVTLSTPATGAGAINQVMTVTGVVNASSLTKTGAGKWILSQNNTYTGPTAIDGGTLVITGTSQATSAINFGGGVLGLNLATPVTAANATVNFTGQSVLVTGATGDPSYTLLTALSIPGTAPTLAPGSVSGYVLQVVSNQLLLVQTGGGTPYDTWAATKGLTGLPGSATDPAKNADPDKDGRNNIGEFAFNGDPLSGSDNGKVYGLTKDSDYAGDPSSAEELILTIAVRTGTAVFAGSPSPSAIQATDGITYSIEGSLDLGSFPSTVNRVPTPVITTLPLDPGMGYEYRSFSLDGSNGLTGKGFLRAKVTSP